MKLFRQALVALALFAMCTGAAAQIQIQNLPPASGVSGADFVALAQSGIARKATVTQLLGSFFGNTVGPNTFYAGPASGVPLSPGFRALVGADLPAPGPSSLGGIQSLAAVNHQWLRAISTAGVPTASQPFCADISDAGPFCTLSALNYSNLPAIAANTILGNNTGIGATPIALSQAQFTALVNNFTTGLPGSVPASGGGTTNFLRADATWAPPPGSGTVSSGTAGQLGWYAGTGTTLSGNGQATMSAGTLTLGSAGTLGSLKLTGSGSGVITEQPQAAAGTYNWNLPTTAGSSGQPLLSGGGLAAPMTFGTLGVAAGGTGLTAGTSGGILGFTGTGTLASSGLLTLNNPVIGGGAGAVPSSGARSGNTTTFATTNGVLTSGDCVKIDASGNLVDNGAVCGGAGGTPGGTSGQVQFNNAGAFGGFTVGADATLNTATGALTVTKTSGAAFVASATTDTTNASNISSGSLGLARIAAIGVNTVLGNNTGISAAPIALTQAQITALLNNFTTTLSGTAPASGGGTTNFLRADGNWAAPAGGTVTSVAVSGTGGLTAAPSPIVGAGTITLNTFTTSLPGGVPASGGGTTNFLRADATWAAPTGSVTSVAPGAGISTTITSGGSGAITSTGTVFADAAYFQGAIGGLTLSNDSVTPNTVLDTAAGSAASDDGTVMMKLGSFTKTLSAWAVGSGTGCLDTGAVANATWYHVFLIERTDTGVVDELCSTSATSPTFPTNYSKKRWVGAIFTCDTAVCAGASTNIAQFKQIATVYYWATAPLDVNTSTLGTSAALQTLTHVPLGVKTQPICRYTISNATPPVSVLLTSPDETDVAPTTANPTTTAPGFDQQDNSLTAGDQNTGCPTLTTNTSSQIRARSSVASTTLAIVTRGWTILGGASTGGGGGGAATPTLYQSFTTTQTGVAPPTSGGASPKALRLKLWGAGGPGGGGALQASGAACSGGGGGGGGSMQVYDIAASMLGATYTLTIPAAPAGGAGAGTNTTAGSAGTRAADTTFVSGGNTWTAYAGGAGAGGNLAAIAGGGGGAGALGDGGNASGASQGTAGAGGGNAGSGGPANTNTYMGSAGSSSINGNAGNFGGDAIYGGAGGASGGGISITPTAANGGDGGINTTTTTRATHGVVGGASPGAGASGIGVSGTGGAGGAGATTGSAQNGGAGGSPAGGGGGAGCSLNGNVAATGGVGGGAQGDLEWFF